MRKIALLMLLPLLLVIPACTKVNPWEEESPSYPEETRFYANLFAFNIMDGYYLWRDQMVDKIRNWKSKEDPVKKVDDLRYKDSSGQLIDKWTTLLEDIRPFEGSLTGNTLSFGFDFVLYYADEQHSRVCAVVTYTYAGTEASQSLRRGSVIRKLDGKEMTPDNYQELIQSKLYDNGGSVSLGMQDGSIVTLNAAQIYENPVQTTRCFFLDGCTVGYLHYTGFTLRSEQDLVSVFGEFARMGVEELVLDLRYNGGGYMSACTCLASLMAPVNLLDRAVFIKDVYNSHFDPEETLFQRHIKITEEGGASYEINVADYNPGVRRVWVITDSGTASASEALICGLKPYMDIRTVGDNTHGKFCGGYLIDTESFFTSLGQQDGNDVDCDAAISATRNWGIYVIASRYSDCNGVTLSMPDGIPADYEARDDPLDGFELGDPSETMLAATLALISGEGTKGGTSEAASAKAPEALPFHRPGFGALLH